MIRAQTMALATGLAVQLLPTRVIAMKMWKAETVILALVVLSLQGMVGGCATGALFPQPEPIVTGDESVQLFAILRDGGHRSPALQDLLLQGSYLP